MAANAVKSWLLLPLLGLHRHSINALHTVKILIDYTRSVLLHTDLHETPQGARAQHLVPASRRYQHSVGGLRETQLMGEHGLAPAIIKVAVQLPPPHQAVCQARLHGVK